MSGCTVCHELLLKSIDVHELLLKSIDVFLYAVNSYSLPLRLWGTAFSRILLEFCGLASPSFGGLVRLEINWGSVSDGKSISMVTHHNLMG